VLPGENGVVDPDDMEKIIRPDIYYMPPTRLLCLENTHNRYGGAVYPIDMMQAVCDRARKANLRLHLDGARIWNASVASGVPFDVYGRLFDTVSVCFSKGLGAPVGSMLLGDAATITRARRFRKIFGGGMRQTGVIAAAARFAVRNNIERLREDHENTEAFRHIVSDIPDIILFPRTAPTNMCIMDVRDVTDVSIDELLPLLASKGVLLTPAGYRQMRAVVHLDTPRERVVQAAEAVRDTLVAL
jgi:threonine aldolase